ncbi:MAG TPA: SH3 domain-containing protein [Woeseiaceae bacterium]|nr:SH3 domain-containing protein [Woeseiaceae bacterium]
MIRFPALSVLLLAVAATPAFAEAPEPRPVLDIIGVETVHLDPEFWIAKLPAPDEVLLDARAIEAQNAKLFALDDSMHDLEALPPVLTRERVTGLIEDLVAPPDEPLFDAAGARVPDAAIGEIVANRNLDAIPDSRAVRYGLVVHRAALRSFPTELRVFDGPGDTDIDRFQESALFPGAPVTIAHESRDGQWYFVVSERYAAWIDKRYVAQGAAADVFGYAGRRPYRIVTGATVETVYTPEEPALSELQLDMGVRLPLLPAWPDGELVNGQHPFYGYVIELPLRNPDGSLALAPALLQRNTDTSGDYLPLTRANIIRQGFKFLGERYGWGHSYGARDCSGFVSEVYRSMGLIVPRNTSDQSVSPALDKRVFDETASRAERLQAVRSLDVGQLVYIPGHVMMVIGHVDGEPWVIHDTTGFGYQSPDGELHRVGLNGVSVTPLLPLAANERDSYVDRMRSIVRVAQDSTREEEPPPL